MAIILFKLCFFFALDLEINIGIKIYMYLVELHKNEQKRLVLSRKFLYQLLSIECSGKWVNFKFSLLRWQKQSLKKK